MIIRTLSTPPNPLYAPRTWNRTAAQIGDSLDQSAADKFYYYGSYGRWLTPQEGSNGRLTLPWNGYGSWPIYKASDATTTIPVWWYTYDVGPAGEGMGEEIPWNPAWIPSEQDDHGLLIDLDDNGERGEGYELWSCFGTSTRPWVFDFLDSLQPVYSRGWRYGDLLTGTIVKRTKENVGAYIGRGAGMLAKRSMILTAEEVQDAISGDGFVHHALAGVGVNYHAGSYAETNELWVAPASRIEHPEGQPVGVADNIPDSPDSNLFPEGTRFYLNIDDAGIEEWLDSRSYSGAIRDTARVIAKTLAVYGWIHVETGTGEPQIECDPIGPGYPSSSTWTTLGLTSSTLAANLLDDLITSSNLVVCNPEIVRP